MPNAQCWALGRPSVSHTLQRSVVRCSSSDREHSKGAEQQCSVVWQQCNAVGFGSLEAAAPPIALICCQRCLGKRGGGCDRRLGFVVAASFSFQNYLQFRWVDKKNIIQARLVSDDILYWIGVGSTLERYLFWRVWAICALYWANITICT